MKRERLKKAISDLLHNSPKIAITDVYEMVDNIYNKKRKVICLCGSTKFKKEFEAAIRDESLKGNIVLSVAQFSHSDNISITDEEKKIFDELHLSKIKMCDEVLIINVDGYIGESTAKEIEYAKKYNKKIKYLV